jgi:hypothetical protein
MLGNLAACRFYEGDIVIATLRFSTHEYQLLCLQQEKLPLSAEHALEKVSF